jgi:hypothetical protein
LLLQDLLDTLGPHLSLKLFNSVTLVLLLQDLIRALGPHLSLGLSAMQNGGKVTVS